MNRDDLFRRQQELLQRELEVRTLMAMLGMKQPPRWNEVPPADVPAETQGHPCHCANTRMR